MPENNEAQKELKPTGAKKVWEIVKTVFTVLVMVIAVAMMIFTIVSVSTFDRNDRDLFGYKAFIVRSDSMKATDFAAGDLAIVKEVDPNTLKEGDIITFQSTNPESYGEIVTHKIRRVTADDQGIVAFVTYGTTTNIDDPNLVGYGYVRGKYEFAIPKVGSFFDFLKTTPGYFVCIFLPFLLMICMQGFQSIKLFRQYKAEQLAELEAKRAQEEQALEAERQKLREQQEESRRMMEQIQQLQQQLQEKMAPGQPPEEQE